MSEIIQIKRTPGANGEVPAAQYPGDAGCDLYVSASVVITPHAFMDIPCGIAIALPDGIWGRITGRSSTIRQRGLLVIEGIIDNGYTGPLFCAVWNLTDQEVIVGEGERIAQLIPHRLVEIEWKEVSQLPNRTRGVQGFGSSGS